MAMFVISAVAGTVMGGVSAAQQLCKTEAQTAQVIQQTKSYIANANTIFDNLETIDNSVMQATQALQNEASLATNQLLLMKQQYVAHMKQMQIGVCIIIIVVFMLLLGKKLKIY